MGKRVKNDGEGVRWGERAAKKHKGFCRAALAVEYAGLKQPKGFWVNRERESTAGIGLVCSRFVPRLT